MMEFPFGCGAFGSNPPCSWTYTPWNSPSASHVKGIFGIQILCHEGDQSAPLDSIKCSLIDDLIVEPSLHGSAQDNIGSRLGRCILFLGM